MYEKSNQSGFSHVLLVALTVIVVAAIGSAGWYVYHANAKITQYSAIETSSNDSLKANSNKSGSNVITVRTISEASPASNNVPNPINPTIKPNVSATPQPTQTINYDEYMNITEWGVKVPTNSLYMGYRWDISVGANDDLVSIFITDDTNGLSMHVGCSSGDIQGVYVSKDKQYHDSDSDFMPDADLYINGHTYYVYKSICQGKVSSSVEKLADKVDLMRLE